MSPSLKEIFNNTFPPGKRDEVTDEEDLWGSELTLNQNVGPQAGWRVRVVNVDVEKGTHQVELSSGTKRTFSNDENVYVESSV